MSVSAATFGNISSNGIFFGFQDSNDPTADGLWNNHSPSFGVLLPGGSGGLTRRAVGPGGNADSRRYQDSNFGVATVASLQDGFDISLEVDSIGWTIAVNGILDDTGAAISGGSGTWAASTQDFANFTSSMYVAGSVQTPADDDGTLTFSDITLTNVVAVPEPSSLGLIGFMALGLLRRRR